MTREEAAKEIIKRHCNDVSCTDKCLYGKEDCMYNMAVEALQEPEQSYDEIMVGDIIKNFGCEYEVHSMSHIKDELFISAYRIRGEEE